MKNLYYLATIDDIRKALIKYYFKSGLRVISIKQNNLNSLGSNIALLILDKFKIKQTSFSISPIWKLYLSIHSPSTKLIVMGFCNFQSRNYIDLLNLPKDFDAYVKNALPVSENWEIPIDGANMLDYLKRFFEGHGGNSLLSKLNQLRQSINIVETMVVRKEKNFQELRDELLLPYAKPEFNELMNRWNNYYPYFEYLPFYPVMQEIQQKLQEAAKLFLSENFSEKLFFNLNLNKLLNEISQKLTEIDKLYIRPEIY